MEAKLINGDCLVEIDKLTDNIDYVFTSPPYNRKRGDKYKNYEDSIDDYFNFLKTVTEKCLAKVNEYFIINVMITYYNKKDVYRYIGEYADKIQQMIVWEKSNPLPASGYNITNAYEIFLIIGDKPIKSNFTYTKNHLTTSVNSQTTSKIHRAVMKPEVADWFIEKFTKEGSVILDPFMGLGTTGVSCNKYNRGFIGIELNKQYYDIACENINNRLW